MTIVSERDSEAKLEECFRANPGLVVDISGPGARRVCDELSRYECPDYDQLLVTCRPGLCETAALVKGIHGVVKKSCAETTQRLWTK